MKIRGFFIKKIHELLLNSLNELLMSLSPKRKTPNPCQGKGLHGQGVGEINYLASTGRTQYFVSLFSL